MSLADFMQELQTQDNIVYSQPPESAIHIIPPEKVVTKIIPPENIGQKPPTTIKLKIKQKAVTTTTIPKEEPLSELISSDQVIIPATKISSSIDLAKTNSVVKKPLTSQVVQKPPPNNTAVQKSPTTQVVQKPPPSNSQAKSNQTVNQPAKPVAQSTTALIDEQIFVKSGTESSKYQIWLDYFNKAKSSKKSNPIVERMKTGRFTLTPDNKVLLLPDYDIVGKDPDDVLKDKWF